MTVAAVDSLGAAGVESTLSFADAPVPELRDRIVLALRYTISWSDAVGGGGVIAAALGGTGPLEAQAWQARIGDVQQALRGLLVMIPPDGEFAGKDAKAAYERTSAAFAQLYRDLTLSSATLPRPELLYQLGELGAALFKFPAVAATTLAEQASNAIAGILGGTTAAIWSALWPWLIVAGAGAGVWYFRAPLLRLFAKGAS
jgi:hypothetical protein